VWLQRQFFANAAAETVESVKAAVAVAVAVLLVLAQTQLRAIVDPVGRGELMAAVRAAEVLGLSFVMCAVTVLVPLTSVRVESYPERVAVAVADQPSLLISASLLAAVRAAGEEVVALWEDRVVQETPVVQLTLQLKTALPLLAALRIL